MGHRLRDQVTFCQVGDRSVFLDVARDRYFCLGARLEATFRGLLLGEALAPRDLTALLALGFMEPVPGDEPIRPTEAIPPANSLIDQFGGPLSVGYATVATIAAAQLRARWRVRRRPLHEGLGRLRARKARARGQPSPDRCLDLAARFNAARRRTPFGSACLPDALALLDILAAADCQADLVFGVRLAPFGAHCWVQSGPIVLNDPLDRARAHTPILVV